jgi:hypothetical protein
MMEIRPGEGGQARRQKQNYRLSGGVEVESREGAGVVAATAVVRIMALGVLGPSP